MDRLKELDNSIRHFGGNVEVGAMFRLVHSELAALRQVNVANAHLGAAPQPPARAGRYKYCVCPNERTTVWRSDANGEKILAITPTGQPKPSSRKTLMGGACPMCREASSAEAIAKIRLWNNPANAGPDEASNDDAFPDVKVPARAPDESGVGAHDDRNGKDPQGAGDYDDGDKPERVHGFGSSVRASGGGASPSSCVSLPAASNIAPYPP